MWLDEVSRPTSGLDSLPLEVPVVGHYRGVIQAGGDQLRAGERRGVDDQTGAQLALGIADAIAEQQPIFRR